MDEEWRRSYVDRWEVSNLGRVRTRKSQRVLTPYIHNGYLCLGGTGQRGGRQRVHRLVCLAFNGPPPTPHHDTVDHVDCNRLNNSAANLQWLTHSQNSVKRDRAGLTAADLV